MGRWILCYRVLLNMNYEQNKCVKIFFNQNKRNTFAALKRKQKRKMLVTSEKKKEIFAQYGKSAKDTGSTEAQIALFTERINHITEHLRKSKKDFSAELSLIKMVGKRRSLLNYLAKTDLAKYRALIQELGIRK